MPKAKTKTVAAPGAPTYCDAHLQGKCTYEDRTGQPCPTAHISMEANQEIVRAQRAQSRARKAAAKADA